MHPKRSAVYTRISRDGAGTKLGVARQEEDCRTWCESRGWTVADVLTDNDASAYSGKPRPSYRRLLEGIEDGTYDAVVAWHPDRLHRRPVELEAFIDVVERSGVAVATVTAGDFDLTTPDGRLTARIIGSVARKESEDKSRRIRRKHLELAEAGKVSGGGRRPFGYEADRVTVREVEAVEVRKALAKVLAGASLRSIVTDWADQGVATVTGATWSPTTVKRLLTSGRIAGQRTHHGAVVGPGEWPAIAEPDDVAKARAILSARSGPKEATVRSYLLTGFVLCGRCEVAMSTRPVIRKGHRYRRYVCTVDRGGCGRVGIGAEGLENLVSAGVLDVIDTPALAEANRVAEANGDRPISEVARVEERQALLAEMFAAGDIGRTEWATARDALQRRLVEAQSAVADEARTEGATQALGDLVGIRDRWPDLSLEQRRLIIAAVVDAIVIAPTTRKTNRFDPDRIEIRWKA